MHPGPFSRPIITFVRLILWTMMPKQVPFSRPCTTPVHHSFILQCSVTLSSKRVSCQGAPQGHPLQSRLPDTDVRPQGAHAINRHHYPFDHLSTTTTMASFPFWVTGSCVMRSIETHSHIRSGISTYSKCPISVFHYMHFPPKESGRPPHHLPPCSGRRHTCPHGSTVACIYYCRGFVGHRSHVASFAE